MTTRTPSERFRNAVASATAFSPSLAHIQRLADRLPSTSEGRPDLRNPDLQGRTSLHLAAGRGRRDVVEWLLEEGVEEVEVSRVRFPSPPELL
jgi:ankyrin repeat protein